jgi:hypothetical protein
MKLLYFLVHRTGQLSSHKYNPLKLFSKHKALQLKIDPNLNDVYMHNPRALNNMLRLVLFSRYL